MGVILHHSKPAAAHDYRVSLKDRLPPEFRDSLPMEEVRKLCKEAGFTKSNERHSVYVAHEDEVLVLAYLLYLRTISTISFD